MNSLIEEGNKLNLNFDKLKSITPLGLIPVVVQDIQTKKVLIIAYTNREAFEYTREHKLVAFWSTSRNKLWIKGKTSGAYLDVHDILVNCEQNSLLYLVKLRGKGACHTKNDHGAPRISCFYRSIEKENHLRFSLP